MVRSTVEVVLRVKPRLSKFDDAVTVVDNPLVRIELLASFSGDKGLICGFLMWGLLCCSDTCHHFAQRPPG